MYVADPAALARLAEELRAAMARDPRLAIDTEFIRERTYSPVLETVQVAAANGEVVAVVDAPALRGDLGPLGEMLLDASVLKIFHAGAQDLEILGARLGKLPAPVYDTQVAAAFAGFGTQTGYGALVQALLGVRLSKEEGFADWSRRPLSPALLAYAENDVRYLHALHDRLTQMLGERGRTAWAGEQMERLLGGVLDEIAPEDLWRRVGGRNALDSRGLAVLRELAIWRDEEARRRDKPRRTTMKDEALVEIARRAPQTADALLALRGIPQNLGQRAAEALAERVRRGLAVSERDRPRRESPPPLDEIGVTLVELFSAVVHARALEEELPPALLATQDDLRHLAATRDRPRLDGPLFTGWRGELIGEALRGVLDGRLTIGWNAARGRLRLLNTGEGAV
jgi:ribonuclease D